MKLFYEFNPFDEFPDIKVPANKRRETQERIAEFVKEQVLDYVGEGTSPVAGEGKFPALSSSYKSYKKTVSSSAIPNLELTGDMLNALDVVPVNGRKLRLQIEGKEAQKAEGHCQLKGPGYLPKRRFIPSEKQTFRKEIWEGIKDILEQAADE